MQQAVQTNILLLHAGSALQQIWQLHSVRTLDAPRLDMYQLE